MKRWALLFSFLSFFIIQLHAIIPHHHHQLNAVTFEDKNLKSDFIFELLSEVLEIDLGENHLSNLETPQKRNISLSFFDTPKAFEIAPTLQSLAFSFLFLSSTYISNCVEGLKNKAPPVLS